MLSLVKPTIHYVYGQPPENVDVLWRLEAHSYAYIDEFGDVAGSSPPRLEMRWFRVKRRTPKGAWLDNRFVLLTANKRFATNTPDEAIASFIARKRAQIDILSRKLARAEFELALINKGTEI